MGRSYRIKRSMDMKKTLFALVSVFAVLAAAALFGCKQHENAVYYYVVFDTNGGSTVEMQKIESGKCAVKPENPEKGGGEVFGGWYTSKDYSVKFDFSTPITKETVVYAKWGIVQEGYCLVTFDTNCATSVQDQIIQEGGFAEDPKDELKKDGYAFSHWYESDEKQEFAIETTPVESSMELNAKWNESGIYEADFEDESLFCMNLYDDIELAEDAVAW